MKLRALLTFDKNAHLTTDKGRLVKQVMNREKQLNMVRVSESTGQATRLGDIDVQHLLNIVARLDNTGMFTDSNKDNSK
tara:strand:+ start:612 stop:848 length:237 start_codon:yes stop_codon:yes gene_type:complete